MVASSSAPSLSLTIPLVDMAQPEEEAALVLKEACEGPGFFYVTNHGVPRELLSRMYREMEALFSLPAEVKKRIGQNESRRGYIAMEEQKLDPPRQKERGDTKEGYYIGVETPEDDPRAKLPLHGPNVWPDPELLPGFRPTMEEYFQACREVSMRIARLMALALGLPADYFEQPGMFDNLMGFITPLHYSLEASCPEEGLFGAGAHTDYGMMALLTLKGPGLQICRNRHAEPQVWEAVDEVEGAYVVNLGDMLERWTNGRWKSNLHRVIIPPATQKDRYSIPFFFNPNFECSVEVLPCCTSPENPPRWPPMTAGEHLLSRLKETYERD